MSTGPTPSPSGTRTRPVRRTTWRTWTAATSPQRSRGASSAAPSACSLSEGMPPSTGSTTGRPDMAPPPRPVMADVAAQAGVSVMTVSRVLNGFPGVAADTRRRVEHAVAALGYHANTAARVLAGGRSRTLGVIAVETEQFGPSHILFGIEAAARAAGHLLSFVTLSRNGKEMPSTLEHLRASHVEGIIVVAPVTPVIDAVSRI